MSTPGLRRLKRVMAMSDGQVQKQRNLRERNPGKPLLSVTADRYSKWYLEFCPTGNTTRSELAEVFFDHAREAARDYVNMKELGSPVPWEDCTPNPKIRHWRHKHLDERQAWAKSIDLLWTFSEGQDVDADALREALVRMSLRRHQDGTHRARNEEHIFVTAASIVREKAGLDRMADAREEAIHEDYR